MIAITSRPENRCELNHRLPTCSDHAYSANLALSNVTIQALSGIAILLVCIPDCLIITEQKGSMTFRKMATRNPGSAYSFSSGFLWPLKNLELASPR